jgi:16S rRNA (guanine966-N2)-methyltransferase
MPRVISGSAGGIHLSSVRGLETRPTADRVKEALFSMLMSRWPPQGFLDLYAGTGQIGLEAASRGADPVVLVEKNRDGCRVIRENIEKTHLSASVCLLQRPVGPALDALRREGRSFSLIFADPPYREALQTLSRLAGPLADLLTPDGRLILEHDAVTALPANVTYLQLERCCQYGTAMLSFYQKMATAHAAGVV